jgi:hypothetical protein
MFYEKTPLNNIFGKRNTTDPKPAIPKFKSSLCKTENNDNLCEIVGYRGDAWFLVKEQQETIKRLEAENVELKIMIDGFRKRIRIVRDGLMLFYMLIFCLTSVWLV